MMCVIKSVNKFESLRVMERNIQQLSWDIRFQIYRCALTKHLERLLGRQQVIHFHRNHDVLRSPETLTILLFPSGKTCDFWRRPNGLYEVVFFTQGRLTGRCLQIAADIWDYKAEHSSWDKYAVGWIRAASLSIRVEGPSHLRLRSRHQFQ